MKRIVKIGLILLSMMCLCINAYAASCSMSMETAKNDFNINDEVAVDVKITNVDAGEGIIALEGTLEYDTNSLTYVKMEGQNGWETPSYNAANGKMVMSRNALVATPETMLRITFKVKEQSAKNPTITLKNITVSGGTATGDIPVSNLTKTITVNTGAEPITPPANNTTTNTSTNTTTNTNTNTPSTIITPTNNATTNTSTTNSNSAPTTSNSTIVATTSNNTTQPDSVKTGILPKTGATRIGLAVLLIAVGVAVVFYIKMKKLDINVK